MLNPRVLIAMTLGMTVIGTGHVWAQKPAASTTTAADYQASVWAASCMSCHGTDGKAEGTGLTIGGRNASELYRLMLAFKNGQQKATIMHQHAKGYSDDELKRITEYFSRLN
jgi:sulfide dehydrogenase cytochrome subunit